MPLVIVQTANVTVGRTLDAIYLRRQSPLARANRWLALQHS
jgi:hypothetical protein